MKKQTIDTETRNGISDDLSESIEVDNRLNEELAVLFGKETVGQASQIDIASLNLNKEIINCIAVGVKHLKELKNDQRDQIDLLSKMGAGERLVLCMWIMGMGLLDKIQNNSN